LSTIIQGKGQKSKWVKEKKVMGDRGQRTDYRKRKRKKIRSTKQAQIANEQMTKTKALQSVEKSRGSLFWGKS
jgi:hypothetical protein